MTSVKVAAAPLAEPLRGGRAGAVVQLHPLLAGEMIVARAGLERPRGRLGTVRGHLQALLRRDLVAVPVPAFLLVHPSAGPIMVDTGFHPTVATDPAKNLGAGARLIGRVITGPGRSPQAQLAQFGVQPIDVSVVVMTHLHFDHASALSEFPTASVVVDSDELAASSRRASRWLRGYSGAQLDGAVDWRTVEYDGPLARPLGSCRRTIDLFGDGSVRLISTPGHTAGHQSVLVNTAAGEVLLTGDAAYTTATLTSGALPLLAADMRRFRASLDELRSCVAERPDLVVVPGHEPGSWPGILAALDRRS